MIKILVITGEASGDFLGASLLKSLRINFDSKTSSQLHFQGVGGPLMEQEGFVSLIDQSRISKMGFIDILFNIIDLFDALKTMSKYSMAWKPDLVITIDSPEFSFRLAKRIKSISVETPIIHYVMPTIWAWRPNRLQKVRKFVDHILALFPFEQDLAKKNQITCDFVGHPIVTKKIPASQDIAILRKNLHIKNTAPIMAVLPGSRISEIKNMLPIFLETITRVAAVYTDLTFVIPVMRGLEEDVSTQVTKFRKKTGLTVLLLEEKNSVSPSDFEKMKFSLFRTAAIALATSGTVVLELARMGVPMVVGYRSYRINELLIKLLVKSKRANLIDIIANTEAMPEFLFSHCNPENLFQAIKSILNDPTLAASQLELTRKVVKSLGFGDADPADRAADSILKFIHNLDKA